MAKPHRGSSLRELFKHGRGECPICKRKNIKILYEQEVDGNKFKICKTCKAAVKNGTKSLPAAAPKAPASEEAPKEKSVETTAAETAAAETSAAETTAAE